MSVPTTATRQYPQSNYNQISYNYGFYVQDDWRVTQNLTLNLGLRYQYNTWPVDSRNQITSFDAGSASSPSATSRVRTRTSMRNPSPVWPGIFSAAT